MIAFKRYWLAFVSFLGFAAGTFAEVHIYFFDVGQGNCILLRNETNAIIIDAGSLGCEGRLATKFDDLKEIFKNCLGEKAKIKSIILTHQDVDHKNLVMDILGCKESVGGNIPIFSIEPSKTFRTKDYPNLVEWNSESCIGKRGLNQVPYSVFSTYEEGIKYIEDFLNKLFCEEEDPPVDKFAFLKANWTTFPTTKRIATNDICLVFAFKYEGFKVLFTGDTTGDALDNYIGEQDNPAYYMRNREIIADTNVFVVPHHGSDNGWCWRWTLNVAKNSPKLITAIINVDPSASKHDHPQSWLVDVPWPKSMTTSGDTHKFFYKRGEDFRSLDISENIFTTGCFEKNGSKFPYIEISIKDGKLQMPGYIEDLDLKDIQILESEPKRKSTAVKVEKIEQDL